MLILMDMESGINELDFTAACRLVEKTGHADQGVGTLREKTLHAVLKRMIEPDINCHEVKLGRYTADIYNRQGVFEVQTGNIHKLKPKLTALLPYYHVEVVVPVIETKWIQTMDPETGELTGRRKSPKGERPADLLARLVYLKSFLKDPNFSLLIVRLEGEELRKSTGKKRHPVERLEFAPTRFLGTVSLRGREDYAAMLPDNLPESFTAEELGKRMGLHKRDWSAAANVLCYMDAIRRTGRRKNAFLYSAETSGSPAQDPAMDVSP